MCTGELKDKYKFPSKIIWAFKNLKLNTVTSEVNILAHYAKTLKSFTMSNHV